MYRSNRPVSVFLGEAETPCQDLCHRFCCGNYEIVQGISNYVLPVKSERALNKFLTEYGWNEDQLNRERLELLQQANDTKWSSEGVVIIDDIFMYKTGEQIPNVGNSAVLDVF